MPLWKLNRPSSRTIRQLKGVFYLYVFNSINKESLAIYDRVTNSKPLQLLLAHL